MLFPPTLCSPGPSYNLLIQTKKPLTKQHVARPCTSLRIVSFIFECGICVRTGYGEMESSQFCLKPDERVNVKWQ